MFSNSVKITEGTVYDQNSCRVCIFVFTAFIHYMLCRDCIHTFIRLLFVSVTNMLALLEKKFLFPFFSLFSPLGNSTFNHTVFAVITQRMVAVKKYPVQAFVSNIITILRVEDSKQL